MGFTLHFHFAKNDFFTNSVLTKQYDMKCLPDPEDPFSFEGPEIFKCVGCPIDWQALHVILFGENRVCEEFILSKMEVQSEAHRVLFAECDLDIFQELKQRRIILLNHFCQHLHIIEDCQPETRNSFRLDSLLFSSLGFSLHILHLGLFLDPLSQFLPLLVLVFTWPFTLLFSWFIFSAGYEGSLGIEGRVQLMILALQGVDLFIELSLNVGRLHLQLLQRFYPAPHGRW